MMKLKNFFFTGALAALAVGLPSCSSDDFGAPLSRKVPMSVTIQKSDDNTRAQLLPDGGDLSCVWQSGDVLTAAKLSVPSDANFPKGKPPPPPLSAATWK